MRKYFLGVDGGNSKTDYLLCTTEGEFVDVYRTGTCSHEAFGNGYDGMEAAMREQLAGLFRRNKITIGDIKASGFGLAGADLPEQIIELRKRVVNLGFVCYGLNNDGILGIKGACGSGAGICAVNGTGTVVLGADITGRILQVGGVGPLSGDYAGGVHIRNRILGMLYNYYYRCGGDSVMFPELLTLLGARPEDLLTVVGNYGKLDEYTSRIVQIGDRAAISGDEAASAVFDAVGAEVGSSVAGCINKLRFEGHGVSENPIDIVLVGSIWHKVTYNGMRAALEKTVWDLTKKHCRYISLLAPPAVGGVLWAKEISDGTPVPSDYRARLLEAVSLEKYEAWVFKESQ